MFLLEALGAPLWQTLTWTLLHFLWQGTVVAAAVAIWFYVYPVRRAPIRHGICMLALLVMAMCPIVTMLVIDVPQVEAPPNGPPETLVRAPTPQDGEPTRTADLAHRNRQDTIAALQRPLSLQREDLERERVATAGTHRSAPDWLARLPRYAAAIQPYCLLAWLLGMSILATRLSASWFQMRWLASTTTNVPVALTAKAKLLSERLGLKALPRIAVSEKVCEAFVVGIWRPLVLLPTPWLTAMPPEMLEAVIAHELAHVRRLDLWVNLLQRITETVLFYHPAVWWLSRRIDREREMCADELAVDATRDRLAYAIALETVGRVRLQQTSLQLGVEMGGNQMELLNRVGNVLGSPASNHRVRWWPAGLAVLALPLVLWLVSVNSVAPMIPTQAAEIGDDAPADDQPAQRRRLWSVTGSVTDQTGRPLEGVEISASCGMGTLMPTGSTTSDSQGRYTLRFAPGIGTFDSATGTWEARLQAATIYATRPGYTEKNLCSQGDLMMATKAPPKDNSWGAKPGRTVLPRQPHELHFVMVPAANVELKLVDQAGRPIADKRVLVQGKQMRPSTSVLSGGKTDAQGSFRFEGLPVNIAWWFTTDGLGRSQPITLTGPDTYRIELQSVHDHRHDLYTIRIAGVTDSQGADVGRQVVGDDPSARPPVSDRLQEQGRDYLKKMAEACRDWIAESPMSGKDIRSFEYRFRLGNQPPETVRVEGDVSQAGRTTRQGIHYIGTPHRLAMHPEKVVFRQVEVDGQTIRLRFLVRDGMKIAAGNGITGSFLGFFSSPLREGSLVLDAQTFFPLRTDLETFSGYVDLGRGRYAPREIVIKRGAGHWRWTFRVYPPGLWLLAESHSDDQAEPLLTIDQVRINGQAAIPISQENDRAQRAESQPVETGRQATGESERGNAMQPIADVVDRWLALIEGAAPDEAAQLMASGKNENADDSQSMTVLLEAATQGRVVPADVYAHAGAALVTSKPLETGPFAGQSFIFHVTRHPRAGRQWRIHEVSLVKPEERVAQLEAFNSKPVNSPVDSRGLGPIVERTLQRSASHTDALDLDTNRVIRVPNDFGTNREVTQDPIKWIAVRGIDLVPQENPNRGAELLGVAGMFRQVSQVENVDWEASAAADINQLLTTAPQAQAIVQWRVTEGPYPVTYLFETLPYPAGISQQGILQVLAVDKNRQTVELRYRLVGPPSQKSKRTPPGSQ